MTISNRLRDMFERIYDGSTKVIRFGNSYIDNTYFPLFLVVRNDGSTFEFPVITPTSIFDSIFKDNRNKNIIHPLGVNNGTISRAKGSSLGLRYGDFGHGEFIRRVRVDTIDLYMGKGVIFDINLNPILVLSVSGDSKSPNRYNIENLKARIYVAPKVFLQENMVDRFIMKTIIPYFLSHNVELYNNPYYTMPVEVIVRDIRDYLFCKPVNPDKAFAKSGSIPEYLLDNLDSIIKILK